MPDSPDQIMRKLQQEGNNLKNILKQKDEELNLECQLWNGRGDITVGKFKTALEYALGNA